MHGVANQPRMIFLGERHGCCSTYVAGILKSRISLVLVDAASCQSYKLEGEGTLIVKFRLYGTSSPDSTIGLPMPSPDIQ